MKRNLLVGLLALSIPVITIVGFKMCKSETKLPIAEKAVTAKIVFVKEVEGRPTFNVVLPDTTLSSMYAEEIAHGLITGLWDYNEDWTITQKP